MEGRGEKKDKHRWEEIAHTEDGPPANNYNGVKSATR